ncbi:replicative DNA helicase [Variovorax boronicumulans]|uniref:DnaB-like helicase C-terminal domain-containing protein n=1 Tax=Variovorax boronicumulans TaxID=436515 RepID=UPI00278A0F30|nr:DnaB-like helicase C-terminal domain-containing protein [Variovorax boronicumulans]MDQ0068953.1 replicative DNA helicase [Variovorax boronicumulans]
MKYDVFISHASEDKDDVARPLAEGLRARGLSVWIDEMELKLGDSLRRGIDHGLAESRYGLVVLSPDFLRKEWPQKELDGLVAREDGSQKIILPVWHQVSREDITKYSPPLADKLAVPTSKGLNHVIDQVVRAIETTPKESATPLQEEGGVRGFGVDQLVAELLDRVLAAADKSFQQVTGVRTGFLDLDRVIDGLQPGTLTLLAGRPLHGKTAFALEVAQHVATVESLPVVLFSPATSAKKTTERLISTIGKIPALHMRAGQLTDEGWVGLTSAVERLHKASIYILDEPSTSVYELQSEARKRAKLWGGVGVVIVDSIQHLLGNDGTDAGEICRELKKLARELNCPVLVTSNLPRTVEARANRRPMLADLHEISNVESHTDTILFAYRHALYQRDLVEPHILEIIVALQREIQGTMTIRLAFGDTGSIENIVPEAGA